MKKLFLVISILTPFIINAQIEDSTKREIKLQGAFNFRDLGGYRTTDGKHIKWGKIYRSAEINNLTDKDLDKLASLSINRVFDFRGPMEVSKAPDRLPVNAQRISLPAGSEQVGGDMSAFMKTMMKATNGDSIMLPFYANIEPFQKRYKPLFDDLFTESKDSAILFHCTAGKDRTGIFAALLLSALDVDTATIFQDYLASNYYSKSGNAVKERMMAGLKMPEQVVKDVLGVKADYLHATFNTINNQYGNVKMYLKKVMGLNKKKIKKLKQLYEA